MIPAAEAIEWVHAQPEDQRVIQRLIDGATATLSRELGIYLGPPQMFTEIKCGNSPVIQLDQTPIPDSLVVSTRNRVTLPWALLDASDYELDGRQLKSITPWPVGCSVVMVEYDAGYAVGQGPGQFRDLVRDMVAMKWASRFGQEGLADGMESETLGDYSYTRGDLEKLKGWREIALSWRRMLV